MSLKILGRIGIYGALGSLLGLLLSASVMAQSTEPSPCGWRDGWQKLLSPMTDSPNVLLTSVAYGWGNNGPLFVGDGAGTKGIYRSADCAQTWTTSVPFVPSPFRGQMRIDGVGGVATDARGRLFAGGYFELYMVSDDSGLTWRSGLGHANVFAPSPVDPNVVYVDFVQPGSSHAYYGLGRSGDGLQSFEATKPGASTRTIAADWLDVDTVYIASSNCKGLDPTNGMCASYQPAVQVSHDGSRTFVSMAEFDHVINAISVGSFDVQFWVATDEGSVFCSDDSGASWVQIQATPFSGAVLALAADPVDPLHVLLITNTNEVWSYKRADACNPAISGAHREHPES